MATARSTVVKATLAGAGLFLVVGVAATILIRDRLIERSRIRPEVVYQHQDGNRFWADVHNNGADGDVDIRFRGGPSRPSSGGLLEMDPDNGHEEIVRRRIPRGGSVRAEFIWNGGQGIQTWQIEAVPAGEFARRTP